MGAYKELIVHVQHLDCSICPWQHPSITQNGLQKGSLLVQMRKHQIVDESQEVHVYLCDLLCLPASDIV